MLTEMSKKTQDLMQIREVQRFMKTFEFGWTQREKKIILAIEKFSGLKFKKNLTCYFVKNMFFPAMSIPLTLRISKNLKSTENILIHELIHNIFSQNEKTLIKPLSHSYPDDDWDFRIHVPLLLIQQRVMESVYGKKEAEAFIKKNKQIFGPEWAEVARIQKKYKNNLLKFLTNETLE